MSGIMIFIKRERLYILLLVFVTLFTALIAFMPPKRVKASARGHPAAVLVSASEKAMNDREAVEKVLTENSYLALMFGLVTLLVIVLFLLGVVIDALLLATVYAGKHIEINTNKLHKVCWTIWDVCKVIILYVFFGYIFLLIEVFLSRIFPITKNDNLRMILNSSVMDILVVVFMIYFTVVQYKESLASLGLSVKNFLRNVWYGVVAYVALIPILIGIIAMISVVINVIKYVPPKQPVVELFLKERNAPFLLYTSLFAAIAGPVIEELFFRGFVYNAIKKYIGIFWATLLTAAMFAGLHTHLVGFLPILALGILLAYLYEKTGTLISSITVHMIHNFGMVLLVFLVKQLGVY